MELRPLGSTGLHVSPIGLGTVKLGRNTGVKYPGGEGFALPTDAQVAELLQAARAEGINVLDTAPAYGTSEQRLGDIMRAGAWFDRRGRDAWVIVTKTGEEFDGRQSTYNFTPEHTRASVERSLERLGCDVLDCVLIHSDGNDDHIITRLGTLEALDDLADRGLLRAYGISTKSPEGALHAAERLAPDRTAGRGVLMATLNPHAADDLPAIQAAGRQGVGVLIKKALASGWWHGSPSPDASQWHRPLAGEGTPQDPTSTDPIEANLRYIFKNAGPAISSIIIGTTSAHHLRANTAAAQRAST